MELNASMTVPGGTEQDLRSCQKKIRRKRFFMKLKAQLPLYLLLVLPIAYYTIFCYVPMYGLTIAFKDFNVFAGVDGSPWVGLDIFKTVFSVPQFRRSLVNTIFLNLLDLALSFPAPILLAVVINELAGKYFKRITQTIIYMPHFLSWVVVAGIAYRLFATNSGMINVFLRTHGMGTIPFLSDKWHWAFSYVFIGIWQGAGWGTIIYLAALTGINPELYEAARVDGASRLAQIWHITLPGMRSTAVMLLILNIGKIMSIGFDRPFLLGNAMVSDFSNVISVYTYNLGIVSGNFSMATAVGLFQSVVGVILLVLANWTAKRLGEDGLI